MIKRSSFRTTLSIVLSLLMLVNYTILTPSPVRALDKKSVLVGAGAGAVAGAGIVLAAPMLGSAVAAAGTGLAGIGSAIVGGLAAAGGAIVGAAGAVGGAIAASVGAIGGFIAGIFASPLFIPALIIIGAAVVGYILYKKYKKSHKASGPAGQVIPEDDGIIVSPGDYGMSNVVPDGDSAAPISVGDAAVVTIGGSDAVVSNQQPASLEIPAAVANTPTDVAVNTPAGVPTADDSLKAAHDRYLAAYQKYTNIVTNSGGASQSDVQRALREYRSAYTDYQNQKLSATR